MLSPTLARSPDGATHPGPRAAAGLRAHPPSVPSGLTLVQLLPGSLLTELIELTALGVGEHPADPIPPLGVPKANRFALGPHFLAEGLRGDLAGAEPGPELQLSVHDVAASRDVFLAEGAQFGDLIVRELESLPEPHGGFRGGAGPGRGPAALSGERRGTEYGQRQQCEDAW